MNHAADGVGYSVFDHGLQAVYNSGQAQSQERTANLPRDDPKTGTLHLYLTDPEQAAQYAYGINDAHNRKLLEHNQRVLLLEGKRH